MMLLPHSPRAMLRLLPGRRPDVFGAQSSANTIDPLRRTIRLSGGSLGPVDSRASNQPGSLAKDAGELATLPPPNTPGLRMSASLHA